MTGPLDGYRIIELGGIGPTPFCGQLLADMGAEVIIIDRPGFNVPMVERRGKKSMVLNLRKPTAKEALLRLVETSDVLIEGFRPGKAEALGLGPEECHVRNPKLVYGRMTGWGQDGPWSGMAGHDFNYMSITGALHAMGEAGRPPMPPLNFVGDYGGGSQFLAMGVLAALIKVGKNGRGDVIDAAIIDGTSAMMGVVYSLQGIEQWTGKREANLLDGGVPFYRCYETLDHQYMAVGPIEPQFLVIMLEHLGISPETYGEQHDRTQWPAQHKLLEEVYRTKTRDQWAEIFNNVDACVTPVLDLEEAQRWYKKAGF